MTQPTRRKVPTRSFGLSLRLLSPERRRLAELIHSMGYGTIRNLSVSDGEPLFTEATQIVRQVKFHGTDFTRPESLEQMLESEAYQRLMSYLDQVRDVRISIDLEVKFSLPFLGEYEELRRS